MKDRDSITSDHVNFPRPESFVERLILETSFRVRSPVSFVRYRVDDIFISHSRLLI